LLRGPRDEILTDAMMSNQLLRTPFGEVELKPTTSPQGAPDGMRVYVLLPDLDELLGVPGFGLRDPIRVRAVKPQPAPLARELH
jgi:hypothetical protein